MSTRLSFSQVSLWAECGKKYDLRYNKKYKNKWSHSALCFGTAIDEGLNVLLNTRDVVKAKEAFNKSWAFQFINKKYTSLIDCPTLVYADKDFDVELLDDSDLLKIKSLSTEGNNPELVKLEVERIKDQKSTYGIERVSVEDVNTLNTCQWLSLRRKGEVMLDSYNKEIMPKIRRVLAVQHRFELGNPEGDTVLAFADAIVEWIDGSIILIDNKTSSREYEKDQASRSQQLIIYYHQLKDEFKIDKVGFIVLNKAIRKNKTKICTVCGFDGSGGRHATCPELTPKRCCGAWLTKLNPDCYIQQVINTVTSTAEDLVIDSFDEVNEAIKNKVFYKNLKACVQGPIICEFYDVCWHNNTNNIILPDNNVDNTSSVV